MFHNEINKHKTNQVMVKIILPCVLFLSSITCISQNNFLSIISSQGGTDKTESISLEWSIGENFVETISLEGNIITQGFHQSYLHQSSTLNVNNSFEYSINSIVYPNPTGNQITIQLQNTNDIRLTVSLSEINGKFIKQVSTNLQDSNLDLDIMNLSSGTYLLKISTINGLLLATHKIIKL